MRLAARVGVPSTEPARGPAAPVALETRIASVPVARPGALTLSEPQAASEPQPAVAVAEASRVVPERQQAVVQEWAPLAARGRRRAEVGARELPVAAALQQAAACLATE